MHTPGPWEAGEVGNGDKFHVYCNDATGQAVAQCDQKFTFFTTEERLANVRLIAAAPEMLAALQKIVANAALVGGNPSQDYDLARAALAKAGA